MKKTCRIAAIPGDGIGKEVLPEGIRVCKPPLNAGICH
jgi:tartrate dehydrogenase/decarboxylase/D-malate dehydrogenase